MSSKGQRSRSRKTKYDQKSFVENAPLKRRYISQRSAVEDHLREPSSTLTDLNQVCISIIAKKYVHSKMFNVRRQPKYLVNARCGFYLLDINA